MVFKREHGRYHANNSGNHFFFLIQEKEQKSNGSFSIFYPRARKGCDVLQMSLVKAHWDSTHEVSAAVCTWGVCAASECGDGLWPLQY